VKRLLTSAALCSLLLADWVLAAEPWDYRVLDRRPHPRTAFTQGLEIHDGVVYESTGNYGRSRVLRYRLDTGELLQRQRLDDRYFGEGLTVLDDRIYQLTWREGVGLIWDRDTLASQGEFAIRGEGWGLCTDGSALIMSDGSATLRWLDRDSFAETHRVTVTLNGAPLSRLNELECFEGRILANIWLTDTIAVIAPATGVVEATLDLTGLLPGRERDASTDVLNGIAWDARDRTLWVTGKHWPWLYQLRVPALTAKPAPCADTMPAEALQ